MSTNAQTLIQQVRELITKQDYDGALALMRGATDRGGWTAHEKDEVICLEEFLGNLSSPLRA